MDPTEKHSQNSWMWVVFTSKVGVGKYRVKETTSNAEHFIRLKVQHVPILYHVEYLVDVYTEEQILEARKLAWSKGVHQTYFSSFAFREVFDDTYYSASTHVDGLRWNTVGDEIIWQRVIPNRPIWEFKEYLIKKDYEGLARSFGGIVSPIGIAHFIGMRHPLVIEVMIMREVTECMKRCGRVWMRQEDLSWVLTGRHSNRVKTDMVKNSLVVFKDGRLALRWVIDALKHVDPCLKVEYGKGAMPRTVLPVTRGVILVDPSLPIDLFLDARVLPSTLVGFPEGVETLRPRPDTIKVSDIGAFIGGMNTAVIVVHGSDVYIRDPEELKTPVRVISNSLAPLREGEIVILPFNRGDRVQKVERLDGSEIFIDLKSITLGVVSVSRLKYEEVAKMLVSKENCGTIVFVVTPQTHSRWFAEMDRFREKSKVINITLF